MEKASLARDCLYCGAENSIERQTCFCCHNAIISEEEVAEAQDELIPSKNPPDVSVLQFTFQEENGISYPNWKPVLQRLREIVPKEDWSDTLCELAKQWLFQLKADFGGHYRCYESENFLVLSADGARATRTMIGYAESSLVFLKEHCRPVLPKETYGKEVILIFADRDDYYTYVSHFLADGVHALSKGMMLHRGYSHIAFPFTWILSSKAVLTHELVHNCIAHLRVPTWLHEGLAQKLESVIMNHGFTLDDSLAARHREHWSEQTIQEFWSGASFYGPGEKNELSYSLAAILVEFLAANWNCFLKFVLEADDRDAGQDASLRILKWCLGESAGRFLGPGNWRPQRKAIADYQKEISSRFPQR